MKKVITPLGALISLIFIPATWIYINQKLGISLYELYRVVPILGFIILGLAVIALILIIIPFFLKNPVRKTLIVGLSVISLILLLAFVTFKDDASRGGEMVELGKGWFGSLLGFVIAFAGAFIKTGTAKNESKLDLPVNEKSSLPMISAVIVLICLPVSIFSYLFLMPPFGSFPISMDGLSRAGKVQYRKDKDYPGVYLSLYGESNIHTIEKMNSAEEAKESIRKIRESMKKEAESSFNRWKNQDENKIYEEGAEVQKYYQRDKYATFITPEDKPEDDYLVYVSGGRANVAWANGNWFCTVIAPKSEGYSDAELSAADSAFDFARRLPYPPQNTTLPKNEGQINSSFYGLIRHDLPLWFGERLLVIIPLIIAAPFLVLLLFHLRKRKTT